VFHGEQGVSPAADRDGRDPEATHVVAVDGGRVVGTCRLLLRGVRARLGRLAVEPELRRRGIGAALLQGGAGNRP
jgi:ElaA protein